MSKYYRILLHVNIVKEGVAGGYPCLVSSLPGALRITRSLPLRRPTAMKAD
jgi:hypothetical protein